MCGRLRVGKSFLHVSSIGRGSHVFGLLVRFHMIAGHIISARSDDAIRTRLFCVVTMVPDRWTVHRRGNSQTARTPARERGRNEHSE